VLYVANSGDRLHALHGLNGRVLVGREGADADLTEGGDIFECTPGGDHVEIVFHNGETDRHALDSLVLHRGAKIVRNRKTGGQLAPNDQAFAVLFKRLPLPHRQTEGLMVEEHADLPALRAQGFLEGPW